MWMHLVNEYNNNNIIIRETLGEDVIFVHLTMNPEDKRKRLQKRHADGADEVIAMMEVTLWSM